MSSCASELAGRPGLGRAKVAVQRMLATDAGTHAVLLYGPQGAGKSWLANLLAKSWLCKSPVEGFACNACNVCSAFDAGRAVDFQLVEPWGPQDLIKASALYPTERWEKDKERPQIDFVLHYFRTQPLMSRNKVVLFDRADRLNPTAANAFLKTLEELGSGGKVILTTSEFTRVIPTIRSRCMCVACEVAPVEPESDAERVFGDSPGLLAIVRERPETFQSLIELMERSRTARPESAFRLAEECRAVAEAHAKAARVSARAANAAVLEMVAVWLAKEAPERHDAAKSAVEAHRRVLGNVQAGLAFENLFLDLLYHG